VVLRASHACREGLPSHAAGKGFSCIREGLLMDAEKAAEKGFSCSREGLLMLGVSPLRSSSN